MGNAMPEDRVFMSTACLAGDKSHRRVLDAFAANGVPRAELTGVHPFLPDHELEALVRSYQTGGMRFTFHNYFPPPRESIVLNLLASDDAQRHGSEAVVTNAVRLAARTGVPLYAFHPGYYRNGRADPAGHFLFDSRERRLSPTDGMARFRSNFSRLYHSFGLEASRQTAFVAVENLFPPPDGDNDSFLCTVEEIDDLFDSEEFKATNLGLLIDLGHLTLSANILGFDRDAALDRLIDRHGDRIYEVHLSENDGREDLHWRVRPESWQLHALGRFAATGARFGDTVVCVESRGMSIDEVKRDRDLVCERLAR